MLLLGLTALRRTRCRQAGVALAGSLPHAATGVMGRGLPDLPEPDWTQF